MCFEIYELDPSKFLSSPVLAQDAALKKIKVELKLLTDIYMLIMAGIGIREGIYHTTNRYAKVKDYNKK